MKIIGRALRMGGGAEDQSLVVLQGLADIGGVILANFGGDFEIGAEEVLSAPAYAARRRRWVSLSCFLSFSPVRRVVTFGQDPPRAGLGEHPPMRGEWSLTPVKPRARHNLVD
jgi:hypothetical protein